MAPRYPTNPHRVTLDLDPITSDALTQAAKAAKVDRQRLAYEFVQRGLGIGMTTAGPASKPEPGEDYMLRSMERGLADLGRLPGQDR